ncbi:MAG: hypothetical protein EVA65_00890 [Oceanococcus sp.]|nr:MAG: hypothetical protein EVA65_00890 [Oceanococcus sp.]
MDERTLRALVDAGGVKKIHIVAMGGRFHVEAATRTGCVTASTNRGSVKTWVTLDAAARWVRKLGIGMIAVDIERWQPGQRTLHVD